MGVKMRSYDYFIEKGNISEKFKCPFSHWNYSYQAWARDGEIESETSCSKREVGSTQLIHPMY